MGLIIMETLYEYTSTRHIQSLYKKAVSKPYTLLDCEEFSNWGKLGLLATILTYFLLPITFLIVYYLYIDTLTAWEFIFCTFILVGYVWLLRKIIDYFLKMYKTNLETAFKNLPSSRNLLLVIKGTLIFLKKHGFTQGQVSSFIDEELRAQVNFSKTTVNVWFGMANKINKKDQ